MERFGYLLLAIFLLTSCAANPPTADQAEASRPLVCSSKAQCDRAWQRVQAWIAQNSRWRIQLANDVTIQTYGPGNQSVDTAYTAVKHQRADGYGAISFRAGCDNIFGCSPEPAKAIQAIKVYAVQE